ncbi:MAG: ABC transporter ATP-binding protein/permease [Muribaculaceae bacterium]|nr:ABC transporter ATP-binding protein/permease [Roseburia sp.]MCM1430900.1 ABC transporter ATP-binding protein/permease [Muribaculaceae bacterium]MCM1491739.1 ABC transporter ATP-binding protein/permease [Muribaculaceae bacterium]
MKNKKPTHIKKPDRICSYFLSEWFPLLIVTITGILYNTGMTAAPWFEGQLAQRLLDVMQKTKTPQDMLRLAGLYVLVILFVQTMRFAKRFYVRRFANDAGFDMKHSLYRCLTHKNPAGLEQQESGDLIARAVGDVDACVEGMRKFTTEIFDTGIVMIAYLALLFHYDWRLTLLSCIFPPCAYILADRLKVIVTRRTAGRRESAGRLYSATLDRISAAMTYRIFGAEPDRDHAYETRLADYEKKSVRAGILETAMQPLYRIISMTSVLFILWFGAKNVLGTGYADWNIAAFTTFLSCFARLAAKSSGAAKLFNAVQKANVSWKRIRPLLHAVPEDDFLPPQPAAALTVDRLSFAYHDNDYVLRNVSFSAKPGQIIGITGPVACGKSTLGKAFLCERPYGGSIRWDGRELSEMSGAERAAVVSYMGHDPELINGTIEENILLGDTGDVRPCLRAVCMEREISRMENDILTPIGSRGLRLSGGQQARIALARTLFHQKPLLILDDPFASLDIATERAVMENLRQLAPDSIVLLISHRLQLFPELDQILWLRHGITISGSHRELMTINAEYRRLYASQLQEKEDKA